MSDRTKNWFDPRKRSTTTEYGDYLPTEPMAPLPEEAPGVATGDMFLKGHRLSEALAKASWSSGQQQPSAAVMQAQPPAPAQQPPQPAYTDTNYGEYPEGHPMRAEYERQRKETAGLAQKLFQAYQSLRGRK